MTLALTPGRTPWGAYLRRALWRLVLALTGGLRVTGTLPEGGCIIVANHASHADTVALLAALPAARRPVAAAAADYWFASTWRRLAACTLVAALPVHRGERGAYDALLAAATPVLRRGDVVVVFPEGTRSTDGTLGDFRSGAARLARDLGVPVVPVALVGTGEVLPKGGRLHPRAIEVRIGEAVVDADCADLRAAVLELRDAPAAAPAASSRTWRLVSRRAAARTLLPLSFLWGLAEALSWPVVAEMYLVLWVVALPRRVLPAACAVAAGSVVGVLLHAALVRHGVELPLPLTTPRMAETAAGHLTGGGSGILHQALDGIPVKVYAAEAGRSDISLPALALWTALERGLRILGVGVVLTALSTALHPVLRRHYAGYLLVVLPVFVLALRAVLSSWS